MNQLPHFTMIFSKSYELCDDCYFVIINSDICVNVIEYSPNLTKGFLCDPSVMD